MNAQATDTWTIGRLLEWTTNHFKKLGLDEARLDAEVLLAHVLSCPRIQLYADWESEVDAGHRASFRQLVLDRVAGSPVAYSVGYREFFSLRFAVDQRVLIPRPETEFLIGEALAFAKTHPVERFLDVGVGSGAIAVTLAKRWPSARCIAIDTQAGTLAVAAANAAAHGVAERIDFRCGDLFAPLGDNDRFDLIASNPPYIPTGDLPGLDKSVREFEPHAALDGGGDGLSVIRRLISEAPAFLKDDGLLLVEIGAGQSHAVAALVEATELLSPASFAKDAAGIARVLRCRRKK